jgi:acetyl-CoA carboxylase biotin carboxyl carrier protein
MPTGPTNVPLNAHITGTVWKIEVKEGDEVAEGQVCVILESMKMEMPVESPAAGKVEKIHVAEGQAVSEGDTLVTLRHL